MLRSAELDVSAFAAQAASGLDASLSEAVLRELCGLVPMLGLHVRPYVEAILDVAVAHLGGADPAIQV